MDRLFAETHPDTGPTKEEINVPPCGWVQEKAHDTVSTSGKRSSSVAPFEFTEVKESNAVLAARTDELTQLVQRTSSPQFPFQPSRHQLQFALNFQRGYKLWKALMSVEIDDKDVWNDNIEQCLIALMVEEVKKGNQTMTTFLDAEYTHLQLKNKYNNFRARQKNFKALIRETGIGYNSLIGEFNATYERWETLFKVHKMAKRFKRKGCKEFGDICLIFGDTTATGFNAHPSTKSPSDSLKEDNLEKEDNYDGGDDEDENLSTSDIDHGNKSKKKAAGVSVKRRKKNTYSSRESFDNNERAIKEKERLA
ncbi:hypothetical protein AKJ16_DCAP02809 [Drosera capensis]